MRKALQDQQDVNLHLRKYIDSVLLNIMEKYPELLEVRGKWKVYLWKKKKKYPLFKYTVIQKRPTTNIQKKEKLLFNQSCDSLEENVFLKFYEWNFTRFVAHN